MTSQINSSGHYVNDKHCIVTFNLSNVTNLELNGFYRKNIINELAICHKHDGFRFDLDSAVGIGGWIEAKQVLIDVQPDTALKAASNPQ